MSEKIDFVLPWVDGGDEKWQKSLNEHLGRPEFYEAKCFRDWDNLRYWFRGVEKYAPWVNRIHFVTEGHLPKWLNVDHPKLNIVKHADYMPVESLPTFKSHSIEINIHRIRGLEEQFVYFNDDVFLLGDMTETDFFDKGLPCASAVMQPMVPLMPKDDYFHISVNNLSVVNHHFNKKEVLRKNPGKWVSRHYGINAFKNFYHGAYGVGFSGFMNFHMANPFLKSTLCEVWEREPEVLMATTIRKFKSFEDVHQYVFSYWQFASGKFSPRNPNYGSFNIMGQNDEGLLENMGSGKYKMICINDSASAFDFEAKKDLIIGKFEQLLPQKSAFEL